MDISQFCNICSSKENVENISTEEKTKLKCILLLLIDKTFQTSIDENNIYICAACCDKLQDIYEFKQLCVKNLLHYQEIYKRKLQKIQSVQNIIKNEPDEEWIEKVTAEPIDLIKNQENITCNSSHFIDTKIKNEIYEDNGHNEVAEKQNIHTEIDLGTMDDGIIIKKQETRECDQSPQNESLHQNEEINNFVPNTTKYFEFVSLDKTRQSQSKIQSELSCRYCDKICQTRKHLVNHELVHTGDKPYKCDVCEKAFHRTAHLDLHKRLHTGETPYKCTVCGKSFRSPRMLARHSHVHTGEKPYKCTMCDKSFIDLPYLKMHYLVHTGETPYKCDVCHASFKNPSNLNRHKRLHTGEKPFHCKFCPKAFSNSAHLTRHLHVHTGERPHECRLCNKKFVTSSEVKQHHRRSH